MKRKSQVWLTVFCSAALLGNSVVGLAQDKGKPAERVEKHMLIEPDGQVLEAPTGTFTITTAPGAPRAGFSFVTGGGEAISGAPPQVQVITSEFNFDSKIVKGAPYSADGVTETIQLLGDGNRIVRHSTAKIYRDSQGRTRREQALNVVGTWPVSGETPTMIHLNDPVAGMQYTLNPQTKTATKTTVRHFTAAAPNSDKVTVTKLEGNQAKVLVNGEVKEVNGDTIKFVTDDNQTVTLSSANREKTVAELKARAQAGAAAAGGRSGEVVSFVASNDGGVATFSALNGAEVNRESLGTQVVEGVQAEGTRITMTIPAGKIGNERPIVTVNERWYSPELQTVVLSKNSDPRMGETTFRLTNLNRSEPDPSLFQVPAEYTVKEGGFGFGTGPTNLIRKIEAEKKPRNQNEN
jgi:hypothetical protein